MAHPDSASVDSLILQMAGVCKMGKKDRKIQCRQAKNTDSVVADILYRRDHCQNKDEAQKGKRLRYAAEPGH